MSNEFVAETDRPVSIVTQALGERAVRWTRAGLKHGPVLAGVAYLATSWHTHWKHSRPSPREAEAPPEEIEDTDNQE